MNAKKVELMGLSEDVRIAVVEDWVDRHRGAPEDSMTGRQVADAINESGMLKAPLTPKKLAPIMLHLGVRVTVSHKQNVYVGLSSIENMQGEIDSAMSPDGQDRCPPSPPSGDPAGENWDEKSLDGFPDGGH
jgi:hypothetical protein